MVCVYRLNPMRGVATFDTDHRPAHPACIAANCRPVYTSIPYWAETAATLGQRLREARTGRGLAQWQATELARVHYADVSHIERGRVPPWSPRVAKLCTALGVPAPEEV